MIQRVPAWFGRWAFGCCVSRGTNSIQQSVHVWLAATGGEGGSDVHRLVWLCTKMAHAFQLPAVSTGPYHACVTRYIATRGEDEARPRREIGDVTFSECYISSNSRPAGTPVGGLDGASRSEQGLKRTPVSRKAKLGSSRCAVFHAIASG